MDVVFGKHWVTQCFDSKGEARRYGFVTLCRRRVSMATPSRKPPLCVRAGRYVRSNLNMPPSLPARGGGHRDYDKDCPITVFGSTQARLVGQCLRFERACRPCLALNCRPLSGEALLESHTAVDFVYCSPSLRCVQTAQHILQGRTTPSSALSKKSTETFGYSCSLFPHL